MPQVLRSGGEEKDDAAAILLRYISFQQFHSAVLGILDVCGLLECGDGLVQEVAMQLFPRLSNCEVEGVSRRQKSV